MPKCFINVRDALCSNRLETSVAKWPIRRIFVLPVFSIPISCLSNPLQATAAKYHQRMEHERKAREDAAKSIVMGLGDGLDSFDSDVLAGIADGIESVLRAPLGDNSEDNA